MLTHCKCVRPALIVSRHLSSSRLEPNLLLTRPYAASFRPAFRRRRRRITPFLSFTALTGVGLWTYYAWPYLSESKPLPMSAMHFTPLTLKRIDRSNADSAIFTFALPFDLRPFSAEVNPNAIQSVYIVQPDIQIQRPYTPLNGSAFLARGDSEFQLLVKRYEDGETSKWLHKRKEGDQVNFRGPVPGWLWDPEISSVVFIAGGTGITPFVHLLHLLSSKQIKHPDIHLVYASKSPESVLYEKEIFGLIEKYPGNISTHLTVDANPNRVRSSAQIGRFTIRDLKQWLPKADAGSRVLVCGPDGLVEAVSGPRPRNSHAKDEVGGMLKELGWKANQVARL